VITVCLKQFLPKGIEEVYIGAMDRTSWAAFTTSLAFFIIFRVNIAYSRFWQGATSTHNMGARWCEFASAICAYCHISKASLQAQDELKYKVCTLTHLLHVMALAEMEDSSMTEKGKKVVHALELPLIDAGAIDSESMEALRQSTSRPELVYLWLQQIVMEGMQAKMLDVPGPILNRALALLDGGMSDFQSALTVSSIPFPFPFAQVTDMLMCLHFLLTPGVVAQWMERSHWAALAAFVQVFVVWALRFTAVELENPFGHDANDLDFEVNHRVMHENLLMLQTPAAAGPPQLHETRAATFQNMHACISQDPKSTSVVGTLTEDLPVKSKHVHGIWQALPNKTEVMSSCRVPPFRTLSTKHLWEEMYVRNQQVYYHAPPPVQGMPSMRVPPTTLRDGTHSRVGSREHPEALYGSSASESAPASHPAGIAPGRMQLGAQGSGASLASLGQRDGQPGPARRQGGPNAAGGGSADTRNLGALQV